MNRHSGITRTGRSAPAGNAAAVRLPHTSEELHVLVRETARRLQKNRLQAGAALVTCGIVGSLSLAAVADLLVSLSVVLRLVAAVWCGSIAVITVAVFVARPLCRRPTMPAVASLIERVTGRMHNRLVTVLDVERRGAAAENPDMMRRLVRQTCARLADYRVGRVARPIVARNSTLAAGLVLLVSAVLFLGYPDRMPVAVARVLRPTALIPPPSWTRLRAEPGDADVLEGEPLRLAAVVERGAPDEVLVRVRTGDRWTTYPMSREKKTFTFTLSAVMQSFDYQVLAGRAWTPQHHVTMLKRPVLRDIEAWVWLPDYMGLPDPRPVDFRVRQVSAPSGSVLQVSALVDGDPVRGILQEYSARSNTVTETTEELTVWFDDHLPPGAVSTGEWAWTTTRAVSGSRSHTFSWSREPYGFSTRTDRLHAEAGSSLVLFAWLDTVAPPGTFTVTFGLTGTNVYAAWTRDDAPGADRGRVPGVVAGRLPQPGSWARLDVALSDLLAAAGAGNTNTGAVVSSVRFEIDGGRAWIDRVGAARRRERERTTTGLDDGARLALQPGGKPGQWEGRMVVRRDTRFAMRFFNVRGHESPAMEPIPVLATADRGPSVIIEKPGRNITLSEAQPVPVVVRVFDDYGVEAVGLETSTAPDTWSATKWIARYEDPETSRVALTGLDPAAHGLPPGQALNYRVLARDRNGQVAMSAPYTIRLATPDRAAGSEGVLPLGGLLDGLGSLLGVPARIAESLVDLLGSMPESERPTIDYEGRLLVVDPDGMPVSGNDLLSLLERLQPGTSGARGAQLDALRQLLREQGTRAEALALRLDEAAAWATDSALGLPYEPDVLREMAARAHALAARFKDAEDGPLDAWMEGGDPTDGSPLSDLETMQDQLLELLSAHELLGADAKEDPDDLASRMAMLRGQQMLDDMMTLSDALDMQQQRFSQLAEQLAALQSVVQSVPQGQLGALAARQQELDEAALDLFDEARNMMKEHADRFPDEDSLPPAPWAPPGREQEVLPVEQDTPEEEPPETGEPSGNTGAPATIEDLQKLLDTQPEWWDRPVEFAALPGFRRTSERYDDRNRRVVPVPAGEDTDRRSLRERMTPRELLEDHQQGVRQQLTQASRAVQDQRSIAGHMAQQIRQALAQMQTAGGQLSPSIPRGATPSLQSLATGQMAELLTMAARARFQMLGLAVPSAPSAGTAGGAPPSAMVAGVYADVPSLDPLHNARLYRLPPSLRTPLLQAMQEEGPEGYRSFIAAYYRTLSEAIE